VFISHQLFLFRANVGVDFLFLAVASFSSGLPNALVSAVRVNGIFVMGKYWCLAPVGLLTYMVYLSFHTGDPLAFAHAQSIYGRHPSFFLTSIWNAVRHPTILNGWSCTPLSLAVCVHVFACGGVLLKQRQWCLAVYMLGSTILALSSGTLTSIPRYAAPLFPMFLVLSKWGESYWIDQVIKLVFFAGLVILTTLYALRFTFAA
jgi:hypothetical protein